MGCGSAGSCNLVPRFLCTLVYVEPKLFFFFRAEKFLSAAPTYGVLTMDTPDRTRVTSSEGVIWGRLGGVYMNR